MQDFKDFEIIVVDDGSTDGSVDVVKGYADPRIKLILHDVNRGVGPARNTGVDAATGEWVVCFDSDDELLPGSLFIINTRSKEVDENISRLQFMVQMDTGKLSPDPPLNKEFLDYTRHIQWMERSYGHLSETIPVVRRVTFMHVKYANDRTLESKYHLDFMKQFNAWSFPDVVRLYHQDAENQLTKPSVNRTIKGALDQARSGEQMLREHGEALKVYAPRIYGKHISGLATLYYLSGNRFKGMKYSFSSIKYNIFSFRNIIILLAGLLGAKPLALLKSYRARLS
jgi:glycosyltransferase involved in cell wall biosynthesis